MYSDSDVEGFELDVYNQSSDESDAAAEVEQQIQMRGEALSAAFQAYAYFFDDEDGFFRSTFASEYRSDAAENALMTSAESWFPTAEEVACALTAYTSAAEGAEPSPTDAAAPSPATAPAAASATAAAGARLANWSEDGKPSPASRFLCANGEACILLPVDKSLNRAALRAAHKNRFAGVASVGADGLDVVPGYERSNAVGWALPLSTDPAVLGVLKTLYPGWRQPTPQDVRYFAKPSTTSASARPGEESESPTQSQLLSQQQPSRRAWTRRAAQLMNSKERLLSCIAAAGGWASVVFVALDVEAYAVTAQSVPLPAEFAFEPVPVTAGGGREPAPLHFFCHPGRMSPDEESTILHTCVSTHFIPYRNAAFLASDFTEKAREVDRQFVRNPAVILINKGAPTSPTLMDLQALRWLYAAARCQAESRAGDGGPAGDAQAVGTWIPRAEDVRCFDISVLEAAAAERGAAGRTPPAPVNGAAGNGKAKVVDARPTYCWYHAAATNLDTGETGVHCAMFDARVLANCIKVVLQAHRPTVLS